MKSFNRCFLFSLPIALYLLFISPSFKIPFYYDDYPTIVENSSVKKVDSLYNYFVNENTYIDDSEIIFQRGLVSLSYALNEKFLGSKPWSFRVLNIVIHLFCALLVLFLFRLLFPKFSFGWSVLAMTFFLFMPGTFQSVIYINSRSELFCTLFMLSSLLTFIKAVNNEKENFSLYYLSSLLFFVLASFSKENFLLVAPTLFLYGFIKLKSVSRFLILIIPFIVVVFVRSNFLNEFIFSSINNYEHKKLLYFFIKAFLFVLVFNLLFFTQTSLKLIQKIGIRISLKAYKTFILTILIGLFIWVGAFILKSFYEIFAQNRELTYTFYSQIYVLPYYFLKIFLPVRLSIIHDFYITSDLILFLPGFLMILLAALSSIYVYSYFKNSSIFVLVASIYLAFGSYFLVSLKIVFNENRLYFPAVFFSLLAAYFIKFLFEKFKSRYFRLFIISLCITFFSVNVVFGQKYFRILTHKETFFKYALNYYPLSPLLHILYSKNLYNDENKKKEAFTHILKLFRLWKSKKIPKENKIDVFYSRKIASLLFLIASKEGNEKISNEALKYLKTNHPETIEENIYAVKYFLFQGRIDKATQIFQKILSNDSYMENLNDKDLMIVAIDVLTHNKELSKVEKIYKFLDEKSFKDPDILFRYGIFLSSKNKHYLALKNLNEALKLYKLRGDEEKEKAVLKVISSINNK